MNKHLIPALLLTLLTGASLAAQRPCPHYERLMQRAEDYWNDNAFEQAFNQLTAAREHCPERSAEVDAQFVKFTEEIAHKYADVERQRRVAVRARQLAQAASARADSANAAAQQAAHRAYANDLASKSRIALKDGDRTAAFRLAEFAHRYVERDNPRATHALIDALYYNSKNIHDAETPLYWSSDFISHREGVEAVAFSPDGQWLATASKDHTVKLWDVNKGTEPRTLRGHVNDVSSVAFTPDGKTLVTASLDLKIKLWDVATGSETMTLNGHPLTISDLAVSPDGQILATASHDRTVKLWCMESGRELRSLSIGNGEVYAVTFSPDGQWLATAAYYGKITLWNVADGTEIQTLDEGSVDIRDIAFSPNGRFLAMSLGRTLKIWDIAEEKTWQSIQRHNWAITDLAFSPDGRLIATSSGDQTAKVWRVYDAKALFTLKGHVQEVNGIAFSPDGKTLATASDDRIVKLWDIVREDVVQVPVTNTNTLTYNPMRVAVFSPNERKMAKLLQNGIIEIWDLDREIETLNFSRPNMEVFDAAFSPSGRYIATASQDGTATLWDANIGAELRNYDEHDREVTSVTFSSNGRFIATASRDSTAKLWDVTNTRSLRTFNGRDVLWGVAFSPDGQHLATASKDGTAGLWNIATAQALRVFTGHRESLNELAFSPDGTLLATASDDKTVKLWEVATGRELRTFTGHRGKVTHVTFSPDGRRLATASQDGTVKLWEIAGGRELGAFSRHYRGVTGVTFSSDGQRLVTSSRDNKVSIWEITADGCIDAVASRRLSGLTMTQLDLNDLGELLDQQTDGEDKLIATEETWQIAAFADLSESQTLNSRALEKTQYDYARAARLYAAAYDINADTLYLERMARLYRNWATDILDYGQADTAKAYVQRACDLGISALECTDLWNLYKLKNWSHQRLLTANAPQELRTYGDYFFALREWTKAELLYEKSEKTAHDPEVLLRLFKIAQKTEKAFDLNRFLEVQDVMSLRRFGNYLYDQRQWLAAKRLYEKAEEIYHAPSNVFKLYLIAQETEEDFDFRLFTNTQDIQDLDRYTLLFKQNNAGLSYKYRVDDYKNAVRIREVQLRLDTTERLRRNVANEYNSLGYYELFVPDGAGAEVSLTRASELDADNGYIPTNLPWAYLLQGQTERAETFFKEWKNKPAGVIGRRTYKESFMSDLEALKNDEVPGIDYELVRSWLEEEPEDKG